MSADIESIESPPLEPEESSVVVEDPEFARRCFSIIEEFNKTNSKRLNRPLITRSERWGLVFRVDFSFVDSEVRFRVNRFVCWEMSDGKPAIEIAIGHALTPLPGADQC